MSADLLYNVTLTSVHSEAVTSAALIYVQANLKLHSLHVACRKCHLGQVKSYQYIYTNNKHI